MALEEAVEDQKHHQMSLELEVMVRALSAVFLDSAFAAAVVAAAAAAAADFVAAVVLVEAVFVAAVGTVEFVVIAEIVSVAVVAAVEANAAIQKLTIVLVHSFHNPSYYNAGSTIDFDEHSLDCMHV